MAKGLSIHIGLNTVDPAHYNGWDGRLQACEYDAQDMQRIAEAEGFESTIILTQEAIAERVSTALQEAATELDEGDILFLTYSGHGGQVPDTNSDEKGDATDETWVLYDRQLVDDELYALWAAFPPGVRIFVLSDSCHSGSVTRELFDALVPQIAAKGMVDTPTPRTRDLPRDVQEATYRANEETYKAIQASHESGENVDVGASVILISGCQDNQLSLDGDRNGLFTQTLLGVWGDGNWEGGYRAFWKAIGAKMPPTQSPNYYITGARDRGFQQQTPLTISAVPAMTRR
jgi:metacaspase-1